MAEDKTKQDETKEAPHAEDTLKSSGGKLFRQGILFSILFHQALILFMTNFSEPVDPFVLKRDVQELANIEIYKPPQKVIQIPEVKAPPKMVMTAPVLSESEDAADTFSPVSEVMLLEDGGGDDPFADVGVVGNGEESDVVVDPTPIGGLPEPTYPESARDAGWEGDCMVGLYIDESGSVRKAWIIRSTGREDADANAITAARGSNWNPGMQGGRAIARQISVTFRFEMKN
ncbi:energy transducer TonB [bacterium]|nr:energy transducer TonB [bacterium]